MRPQFAECPKLKNATALNYKQWAVDVRRWERTTSYTPPARVLKVLEAIPANIKNLFQHVPDDDLFAPDGMDRVMAHVQTQCGMRPEDGIKDIMDNAMDIQRRKSETIPTWLSRCHQAWLVAEGSQVCQHSEITTVHLLSLGARLTPLQLAQFNMLMMGNQWGLERAKQAYLTIDRSDIETDGKKTHTFMVESEGRKLSR